MKEEDFDNKMDLIAYQLDELSQLLKTHKINGEKNILTLQWLLVEMHMKLVQFSMFSMKDYDQRLHYFEVIEDTVKNMKAYRLNDGL